MTLDEALRDAPLIAIVRGVTPAEVVEIGEAIVSAGIKVIETPLNSPSPFASIEKLAAHFSDRAIVGGGTILTTEDLDRVADAGGRVAVAPNTNPAVIERALERGLEPLPGFFTPSEAFAALKAGARRLKLFPASSGGPQHLAAIRTVLPSEAQIYAVGGARPADWAAWKQAGAAGLGLGSELYRAGQSPEDTHRRALDAVASTR